MVSAWAMIREATVNDAPAIWRLAQEVHSTAYYSSIPLSEQKCKRLISMMIGSPTQFAWLAERGGEIQGVLLGGVDEILWSTKKEASDILFYVRNTAKGDGVRLARQFIGWARNIPSVYLVGLSVSTGNPDEAERLYEGLGLRRLGGIYVEVVR